MTVVAVVPNIQVCPALLTLTSRIRQAGLAL